LCGQLKTKQKNEYFKMCSVMLLNLRHFCKIVKIFYRRALSQQSAQLRKIKIKQKISVMRLA